MSDSRILKVAQRNFSDVYSVWPFSLMTTPISDVACRRRAVALDAASSPVPQDPVSAARKD